MCNELATYVDYQSQSSLNFWRSTFGDEVDFILEDRITIEVKGKERVGNHDLL
ncbi:MAG: hypothetical protein KBD78_02295 [Oligoflexales bacterium]|nr:hypothetical protein [Oligoflexales bacterium]